MFLRLFYVLFLALSVVTCDEDLAKSPGDNVKPEDHVHIVMPTAEIRSLGDDSNAPDNVEVIVGKKMDLNEDKDMTMAAEDRYDPGLFDEGDYFENSDWKPVLPFKDARNLDSGYIEDSAPGETVHFGISINVPNGQIRDQSYDRTFRLRQTSSNNNNNYRGQQQQQHQQRRPLNLNILKGFQRPQNTNGNRNIANYLRNNRVRMRKGASRIRNMVRNAFQNMGRAFRFRRRRPRPDAGSRPVNLPPPQNGNSLRQNPSGPRIVPVAPASLPPLPPTSGPIPVPVPVNIPIIATPATPTQSNLIDSYGAPIGNVISHSPPPPSPPPPTRPPSIPPPNPFIQTSKPTLSTTITQPVYVQTSFITKGHEFSPITTSTSAFAVPPVVSFNKNTEDEINITSNEEPTTLHGTFSTFANTFSTNTQDFVRDSRDVNEQEKMLKEVKDAYYKYKYKLEQYESRFSRTDKKLIRFKKEIGVLPNRHLKEVKKRRQKPITLQSLAPHLKSHPGIVGPGFSSGPILSGSSPEPVKDISDNQKEINPFQTRGYLQSRPVTNKKPTSKRQRQGKERLHDRDLIRDANDNNNNTSDRNDDEDQTISAQGEPFNSGSSYIAKYAEILTP